MEMRSTAVDNDSTCFQTFLFCYRQRAAVVTPSELPWSKIQYWDVSAYIAAWPAWIPVICDMLRQWQWVWRVWPYTPQTLCIAKCYWIVYCHKSQTLQWPSLTAAHPVTTLSDVQVWWTLRSVAPASRAEDFKRSTWLLITSASLSHA